MANGENFKCTVIAEDAVGTAFVFDFGYADQTSSAHLDTGILAGDFQTLVQTAFLNCLPDTVFIHRYRAACVANTHKGEIGFVDVVPPQQGTLTPSYVLPGEIAISLKRNTGHASRRDRGRIFFGPVGDFLRDSGDKDKVDLTFAPLGVLSDLLKSNLVSQTVTLVPVILAADGSYSGRKVIHTAIGEIFVHHKTRRRREGI